MADDKELIDIERRFTGRFLLWFSAGIILASIAFFFAITFIPIPANNQRYADMILGFVGGTLIGSILNFYWGSSKTSKDKDDAFVKLVKENGNGNGNVNDLVQGGKNVTVSPADKTKTIVTDSSTTITPNK